ncbi:hypothetical protein BFW01_g1354 [Lasiodiplodia theobromae]|uniref:Uncharacterized protein n=1 Tax=Lasiodiplodia theobromae TaxID=45133 RepID=A0A8H7IS66_9PEZI|nr:hypothetical protein BFW01_g1354 [Lasiodiplodia theobromae]
MKLCYSLYKIADAIGTARHEASLVAAEVSAFSHALNAVSKCVDKPSANTKELHQTVLVLLNCCNGVITDLELELCVQDLAHPFMSPSRWAKFRVRIIWLFQRPKVCFLRQSMESLKMSLHLLVSTMDFTEAVKMRAPSVIV